MQVLNFFFLRFRILDSIIIPMLSRRIGLSQYKNLIAKADTISEQNRYTGLDTLIVGNTILTAHSSQLTAHSESYLDSFLSSPYKQHHHLSAVLSLSDTNQDTHIPFSHGVHKQLFASRKMPCVAAKGCRAGYYKRLCNTALYRWGRQSVILG